MMMIYSHTYGTHAHMMLMLDNGEPHEIDVYWRENGESYKTDCDDNEATRNAVINAFKALY